MHDTAEAIGAAFLEINSKPRHVIVEVGAFDVNGSIRNYAHPEAKYLGIDVEAGPSVDILAKDEFVVPLDSRSADIVVATSVFEHAAFFWVTMLELLRITKPGGLIYISAPSNGCYHRYPTDNWRFYPDAGKMLERWGQHNGYAVSLVESFIAERRLDMWNDFVAVFQVGPPPTSPNFLSDRFAGTNVWKIGAAESIRVRAETDGARIDARSSSRYGSFDFGTNASRVRGLMNEIEDAIRAQRPERPPAQPSAKKSTPGKKDQSKK
jgi:SAM-dependent methyltransferase